MNQSGSQTLNGGNPSKVIQDRIALVEHHFGEICDGVGGYARALGKLRNKGDQIAKALRDYAQHETHNATTQAALREFVNHLSVVGDYRNTEVQRIEAKVITPLTAYGKSCKQSKERIKTAFNAHEKEIRQKRIVDRLMERNPRDSRQITQAQTELQKAALEAAKAQQDLEQEMDSFEKKKLKDIKQVMSEFVIIQLAFHSKALEYFSQSFQSLTGVHEDDDLEEFHNSLRPMMIQTRQDAQRQMNATTGNALPDKSGRGVTSNLAANSNGVRQQQPKQEHGARNNNTLNSTNPSSLYSQTTQDDDDDDDDEVTDEDDDDDDDDDDDTELPTDRGNQKQLQSKPQVEPPRR